MSALSPYLPWLGWAFLPSLATTYVQKGLYTLHIIPPPSTPSKAVHHAFYVRSALILLYFGWTLWSSVFQTSSSSSTEGPSAYSLLGITDLECGSERIKRQFRKMSMIYHPDKMGPQGEQFFIAIRRSHDVLSEPVKRWAYDRFGIDVLNWKDCLTQREHLLQGLRSTMFFYTLNPLMFFGLSFLTRSSNNGASAASIFSFWHATFLVLIAAAELTLVTDPTRPSLLKTWLPRWTIREVVLLLRQIYTGGVMAIRQLTPFIPPEYRGAAGGIGELKTKKELDLFLEQVAGEMAKMAVGSGQVAQRTVEVFKKDLQPFESKPISGAATLPEAARTAAIAAGSSSDTTQAAPSAQSTASNRLKDTYVHLVKQALLRKSNQQTSTTQQSSIQATSDGESSKPAALQSGDEQWVDVTKQ